MGRVGRPRAEVPGLLHVGGGDDAGVLGGGLLEGALGQMIEEPGQALAGLEEQGQGGGLEGVGVDADLLQAGLDIAAQLLRGPGLEAEAEAQASQERRVDAHLESGQELFVADQHQAERGLSVVPVARQQTHFLQRRGTQVLGFVQDDHRPEPVPLLPALADEQHVVAAALARLLASSRQSRRRRSVPVTEEWERTNVL